MQRRTKYTPENGNIQWIFTGPSN